MYRLALAFSGSAELTGTLSTHKRAESIRNLLGENLGAATPNYDPVYGTHEVGPGQLTFIEVRDLPGTVFDAVGRQIAGTVNASAFAQAILGAYETDLQLSDWELQVFHFGERFNA